MICHGRIDTVDSSGRTEPVADIAKRMRFQRVMLIFFHPLRGVQLIVARSGVFNELASNAYGRAVGH